MIGSFTQRLTPSSLQEKMSQAIRYTRTRSSHVADAWSKLSKPGSSESSRIRRRQKATNDGENHLKDQENTQENVESQSLNPKDAIGRAKPPITSVPLGVMSELGAAMYEGASKYGRHNYRIADVEASVYIDAAWRHIAAWWEGESIDPDSGVSHITKAIASLVVLRDADINEMIVDDRPPATRSGHKHLLTAIMKDIDLAYPNKKEKVTWSTKRK